VTILVKRQYRFLAIAIYESTISDNREVIGAEYEDGLNRPDIVRHPDPSADLTYTSPTPTTEKRKYCRLFLFH
jgi:hypothetical protein